MKEGQKSNRKIKTQTIIRDKNKRSISGDIMKLNKYVFGILIILVSVSLTQATTAEPQILSNSSYIDSSNYFTVVGEVQNNLGQNIQSVMIISTFYDKNNTVIGTDYTFTDISILKPGQKSPFEISSYPDKIIPARYALILSYSTTTLQPFSGLQILSNTSTIDSSGYYNVVGEIKNNGLYSSSYIMVVATYYNSSNIVIGKAY